MRALFYIVLIIALLSVQPALSNELKLAPSVTLKEEYNDNIFFSINDRKSDFISTLTPGIELSDRSERLNANILLRLNGILYARTSELSAVDQDYRGRLSYLLSPRTNISSSAEYIVDSQPDREVATTGLVLQSPVKRHRQLYSLTLDRAITEKTSVSLAYSYEQDDYDNKRFSDLKYHDANLTLNHDLDWLYRSTKGIVSFDYAHYKSSSSTRNNINNLVINNIEYLGLSIENLYFDSIVDNYSATVGLTHAYSELWSIQANVGGRYTVTKSRTADIVTYYQYPILNAPFEQTGHEWGWVGQLALSYKGEKTEGSLSFNADVQPASGQASGTSNRIGLVADARRRFTYELSGDMAVGYYRNKSTQGINTGQAVDQDTVYATPSVRYEFNKDMYVEASYQFTKIFYNLSHQDTVQNKFLVRFYIQHPFFM